MTDPVKIKAAIDYLTRSRQRRIEREMRTLAWGFTAVIAIVAMLAALYEVHHG